MLKYKCDWWYFHYKYSFVNCQHKVSGRRDILFYETLKEVCNKKKTSPSAVCDALGMSRSNITEWKKGRSPKLDTVVQIAEHLGVSPMKLIPKKSAEE